MLKKSFTIDIIKSNDEERSIEFTFSTGDIDRGGERIDQESWNLKNFKKNPVVLFSHDSRNIAVGKIPKIGLDEKGNLSGKILFATEEGVGTYGDLIKTLYNLYKNGFMSAVSVGFTAGEVVEDKKGIILKNNELLEVSLVSIPANQMALAKQKGIDLTAIEELDETEETEETKEKEEVKKEPEEKIKKFILNIDREKKEMTITDEEGKIHEVEVVKNIIDLIFIEKVVPESSDKEQKEKSSKTKIRDINKAIRKLLIEKQKERSK